MFELVRKNPRYLIAAIIVHVIFIVILGVNFSFDSEHKPAAQVPKTVQVQAVDERKQQQEQRRREAVKRKKQQELAAKKEKIRQEKLRKEKVKKEKQRLALLEKERKKKAADEKRRQQALEKKRLEEEKKRKAQQQKEQAERDAALKRKLEEAQKQLEKDQLALAEQKAQQQREQSEIDKYMAAIAQKIRQNWVVPPNYDKKAECLLDIRLMPTGDVLNVKLLQSCGHAELDASLITAVKNAEPLPLPGSEKNLFNKFREIELPLTVIKRSQ